MNKAGWIAKGMYICIVEMDWVDTCTRLLIVSINSKHPIIAYENAI